MAYGGTPHTQQDVLLLKFQTGYHSGKEEGGGIGGGAKLKTRSVRVCILICNIIGTSIYSSKPLKSIPGSRVKRQVGSGESPHTSVPAMAYGLWRDTTHSRMCCYSGFKTGYHSVKEEEGGGGLVGGQN